MTLDLAALANLSLAISVVVALILGLLQLQLAARDRRERFTIEVVRGIQSRDFAEQMVGLRNHAPPRTAAAMDELPPEERVTYLQFSQEMEMLGLLVHDRTVDLELVERTLGSFVVLAWDAFKPGVLELRSRNKDPYLSEYFEWLAECLRAMMRDRPRTPAYA